MLRQVLMLSCLVPASMLISAPAVGQSMPTFEKLIGCSVENAGRLGFADKSNRSPEILQNIARKAVKTCEHLVDGAAYEWAQSDNVHPHLQNREQLNWFEEQFENIKTTNAVVRHNLIFEFMTASLNEMISSQRFADEWPEISKRMRENAPNQ